MTWSIPSWTREFGWGLAKLRSETQPLHVGQARASRSYWSISLRRLMRKKLGVTCLIVIALMYGSGIVTIFHSVTPYGYKDQNRDIAKQPPPESILTRAAARLRDRGR